MAWTIKVSDFAAKQIKKLDKGIARKIIAYLREKVATQTDPRTLGKALMHDKSGLWRYRIEDYRIICEIENNELTVMILRIAHRKNVYED